MPPPMPSLLSSALRRRAIPVLETGARLRGHSTRAVPPRRWGRRLFVGSLAGTALAVPLVLSPSPWSARLSGVDHGSPANDPGTSISTAPLSSLLRTYLVFTLTSFPSIVDHSPAILSALTRSPIPGVAALTEWAIRRTFFAQFVGGESVRDCAEAMREMRARGVGTLLAYSVEVDEETLPARTHAREDGWINAHELEETLHAIREARAFEDAWGARDGVGSWVAVKITGLIKDPEILHRASNTLLRLRGTTALPYPGTPMTSDISLIAHPAHTPASSPFASLGTSIDERAAVMGGGVLAGEEGVRPQDEAALRALYEALREVGQTAKEAGIRVVIDAEHTWYQPVLDAYTMMLSQEFNRLPPPGSASTATSPLVYGTYQCYLTRMPTHLVASLEHAKANGYALGVKLVRGAYHEQERKRWSKQGRTQFGADPIWPSKSATDRAYDDSLDVILSQLEIDIDAGRTPQIGVLFGTHNAHSCELVLEGLEQRKLATRRADGKLEPVDAVRGRVCIGQLYGMSDELTERVANAFYNVGAPMVLKYVPYGKLSEVLPYLGRRAVENKALLTGDSGTAAERRRIMNELKRRMGLISDVQTDNKIVRA